MHDENTFDQLTEEKFQERFRFSKDNTRKLLRIRSPGLQTFDHRAHAIPKRKQMLIALRFFAIRSYHREIGDLSKTSESTTCSTIHKIAFLICQRMRVEYVYKISTPKYGNETKLNCFYKYGFPGVLSVVDGSHVPILCPSTPDNNTGIERMLFY